MVLLTEADYANLSLLQHNPLIRQLLECATVVASDAVPPNLVTMNTQLVLRDGTGGERRAVRIVFPEDAEPAAGLVSILDPLAGNLLATVMVGLEPEGVGISPDDRWVYVTAETSNNVSVIDTTTQQVVASFLVDPRPRA